MYASRQSTTILPIVQTTHKSLLRRQLRDVDMWMQDNKISNLEITLKHINGLVLEPGQRFSYWRQIGEPTTKKGYLKGMILQQGLVKSGVGGGLCQLSNLIYWMTLHTPLTVTQRWRHSYDVFPDAKRTLPFGSGATCSYPNIDLEIHNMTQQSFQLIIALTDTHLTGEWRSVSKPQFTYTITERNPHITHEPWGGYMRHNTLVRQVTNLQTDEVYEEIITENHAKMMYEPLLPSS